MYIGVDYYPEHWPETRMDEDMRLMREAGFNVVRLAEFDWVSVEPEEGSYRFEFWDRVLMKLADHGISAIMCTPTAAMPAWVKEKYPKALALDDDGRRLPWGGRKNNCFTNPDFRRLSNQVTVAMAEHFSAAPNVIGWQTDNEFGQPRCYCDSCRASFQNWLKDKYGTLDALNAAWGTHFWGHRCQTWEEIPVPVGSRQNPSLRLDWRRHFSWLNVRFQRDQIDRVRAHCPNHFVTHNMMGLFPELNYYDLGEDLDFVGWDSYPIRFEDSVRYGASCAGDLMRGVKKKNYWIMEQTAGPPGSNDFARNPRPGEIRSVAYQHLAHGADGMLWFRWRTCTTGVEQYWHGLLGHDGRPLRRYQEAKRVASEFRSVENLVTGTTVKPNVAIVYDYDSLWSGLEQPGFKNFNYAFNIRRYYDALFRAGVNVDFIRANDDVTNYDLVLAPGLIVTPDDVAARFTDYVKGGGVFLADCRTGVKDESNRCHERTLPGKLTDVLGVEIQEYEALGPDMTYDLVGESDELPGTFTAIDYADWTTSLGAERLVAFKQWHLEDMTAVSRNRFGEGVGFYVSTVVKETEFYDRLIDLLLETASIKPVVVPPKGVEAVVREKDDVKLLFLINHTEEEQIVSVPTGKRELLTETETSNKLALGRHEVAVVSL